MIFDGEPLIELGVFDDEYSDDGYPVYVDEINHIIMETMEAVRNKFKVEFPPIIEEKILENFEKAIESFSIGIRNGIRDILEYIRVNITSNFHEKEGEIYLRVGIALSSDTFSSDLEKYATELVMRMEFLGGKMKVGDVAFDVVPSHFITASYIDCIGIVQNDVSDMLELSVEAQTEQIKQTSEMERMLENIKFDIIEFSTKMRTIF